MNLAGQIYTGYYKIEMSANHISNKCRIYVNGKAASKDIRQLICDDVVSRSTPEGLAHFKGVYKISRNQLMACSVSVLRALRSVSYEIISNVLSLA